MTTYLIPPDHPYIAQLRPAVWRQSWDGKWTVRWRTFDTMKQSDEFDTEAEARRCARKIMLGPHWVEDTCGHAELIEWGQFWRNLQTKG